MSRQLAAGLTVIFLLALLASNPSLSGIPIYGDTSLLEFWVKNIALAMPPAFTLGMCTVLLYKGFRYPRGTVFTILGLLQLVFVGWLIWLTFQAGVVWVSLPILLLAAFMGPKSARATWKWLGVDRYYRIKAETDAD
ncbi:MAG: Uncharacterised protein [Prochlorococcus marinus str. MIT 9313]|nr:MAG: Uncharacterised protein [Prochlorococcus marinus str. MIT 9313]